MLPGAAEFLATLGAQYLKQNGTSFPVSVLAYDAAIDEEAYWKLSGMFYGSGNLTVTIYWLADTATSGDVVWEGALAAYTPDTDSSNLLTKALDTPQTVTDTQLGTTARRLQTAILTLSNTDGLASGDGAWMRIRRLGSNGSDTMTGDAWLERVEVTYSAV
jgi:hypothetical protein